MTEYSLVYSKFKDKITDPDLLLYLEATQQEILFGLLSTACSRFKRICKIDLYDRDDTALTFNTDLGEEITDIITELMVEIWLKPFLNNSENLRNRLNTKDFEKISPANLLNAIQNTYNLSHRQAKSAMNEYSFVYSEIENLKS